MLYKFGIDPLHFGLLMTVNLGDRLLHSPSGSQPVHYGALCNRDLIYMTRSVLPFVIIQVLILFVLTYWPDSVLWLPPHRLRLRGLNPFGVLLKVGLHPK